MWKQANFIYEKTNIDYRVIGDEIAYDSRANHFDIRVFYLLIYFNYMLFNYQTYYLFISFASV